jgi:hypothetical protein
MNPLKLTLLAVVALVLTYCSNSNPKSASLKDRSFKVQYSMDEANMFDTTVIKTALVKANRHQKAESRRLFLQGLDLLANKQKPTESIEFFKESILYYPDEKNYLHLFKAYVYSMDTTNAAKVNDLITVLAPQWGLDYYEIDFNAALIAAVKKDTNLCMITLSDALMNGFIFKDRITDEPLFKFMENSLRYQSFVASNFGSDEKLNYLLYKAFVNYYPDLELPYEIGKDSVRNFNYDHYINYTYATLIPGMNEGSFARDVTNEYMYVGKIKLVNGHAFIYKSYLAMADTLNPVKTFIVTYDSTGIMKANEMISCFCSPTESKSFSIDKDLNLTISDYSTSWEKDPIENGYAGNAIKSMEETSKSILMIDKDGNIIEQNGNVAYTSPPKKE